MAESAGELGVDYSLLVGKEGDCICDTGVLEGDGEYCGEKLVSR